MTAIIDTSFLFALTNRNDKNHEACLTVAQQMRGRFILPMSILPEIAYLLDSRLGHHVMREFIAQVQQPAWTLTPVTEKDLERSSQILKEYADLRIDFVDTTIVAVAERLKVTRVLTLDRRHFRVIRPLHCPTFTLLPE